MNKNVKLFTYVGRTIVDCKKVKSLESYLPTPQEIVKHMMSNVNPELTGPQNLEKYRPMYMELEEETYNDIVKELKIKSSSQVVYASIIVMMDSYSSRKSLPILIISVKKDESV